MSTALRGCEAQPNTHSAAKRHIAPRAAARSHRQSSARRMSLAQGARCSQTAAATHHTASSQAFLPHRCYFRLFFSQMYTKKKKKKKCHVIKDEHLQSTMVRHTTEPSSQSAEFNAEKKGKINKSTALLQWTSWPKQKLTSKVMQTALNLNKYKHITHTNQRVCTK